MPLLGVGIDVVDVARVERLVTRHGARFVTRWFTPAEAAWARGTGREAVALSTVLACKEAVWKALPVQEDGPVPWRSLQVLPGGAHGARVSLPPGLVGEGTEFEVDVSRGERHVLACVMAWCRAAAAPR